MGEGLEERALLSVGLDPGWGFGGVSQINVPASTATNDYYQSFDSIALQNGQVVEVGTLTNSPTGGGSTSTTNLIVARLTTNGYLDPSFGSGGIATIPLTLGGTAYTVSEYGGGEDIAVQSNGSIDVLATVTPTLSGGTSGSPEFLVAQLTPGGSLDTSFGTGGGQFISFGTTASPAYSTNSSALAIGSNGKIVAVGTAGIAGSGTLIGVAQLNANGSLDTTFNSAGTGTVPGTALVNFKVGDTSAENDSPSGVVVQSNGAIVVVGTADVATTATDLSSTPSDVAVARLTATGTLDTSFNAGGTVPGTLTINQNLGGSISSDSGDAVTLSGSQIVIAGTSTQIFTTSSGSTFTPNVYDLVVYRLNTDGSFDTSFNGSGKYLLSLNQGGTTFNTSAASVVASTTGAIVVGGSARQQNTSYYGGPSGGLLLSLTPTGTPDTTFGSNGAAIIPESVNGRMLMQTDGKLVFLSGNDVVRTTPPTPAASSTGIVVTGSGKKAKASGVTITFNTAVNPALLTNPNLYQVRALKGHRLIKIRKRGGVIYDAATQTLTLNFAGKTALGKGFQVTVLTGGIVGADGQVLPATPILIMPPTT